MITSLPAEHVALEVLDAEIAALQAMPQSETVRACLDVLENDMSPKGIENRPWPEAVKEAARLTLDWERGLYPTPPSVFIASKLN